MVSDRWARKIVALLHDPPDKPFGIERHRQRAEELQRKALGRAPEEEETHRAERADRIASAADRVDLPEKDAQGEYLEAYWHRKQAVLIHPLAGRELELGMMSDVSVTDTHDAALKAVAALVEDVTGTRLRFLRLWRRLPETLADEFPHVGKLFGMLPADTRQPEHPLQQHLSITAAIADALPQPALLVFSIGPVQEFIAAARRTQDLWMGSWLLSYLSWAAMESIAKTHGPDTIVFPSLRGQPLCNLWLKEEGVLSDGPEEKDLALATLPNKFVALLPASEAEEVAKQAENSVRQAWREMTEKVREALEKGIVPADDVFRQMWQEQVSKQVEVYWVILPWPGHEESASKKQADEVVSVFKELCRPSSDWLFGKAYELFSKPKEEGGGQYHPNWGTTYSLLYDLADRAFNARKNLRDFRPAEEQGEKCTVCGQRAALHGRDGSHKGVRDFWGEVARALKGQNRYEIKPDGRERLCAVCAVKRFVQCEALQDSLGIRGGFPSTSEVTVASFKAAVLQKLGDPKHGGRLVRALKEHLDTLESLDIPHTVAPRALPRLWELCRQLPREVQDVAKGFLRYDGEFFFSETFTRKRFKEEYGVEVSESDLEAVRKSLIRLLQVSQEADIPRPPKYYAILRMDGDHAGRWLSGTHEGLTCFGNILHPVMERRLETLPGWENLLPQRRIMTPALHAAISEALARFALRLVRYVVEERHCGRVVYAGGDDVLALLPLGDALSAARELRALFSGEVRLLNPKVKPQEMDLRKQGWVVAFGNSKCTGYLRLDEEILLTMGPTATASIGIAIAHHLQPLDTTLQAAREAEHAAKETYERNAFCIHLLKRSGEEVRVGAKWFYDDMGTDTIALIMRIYELFNDGRLSMRLAHAVFEKARTLAHLPDEAQRAELGRLIKRHSEREMPEEERRELAQQLAALAMNLDEHAGRIGKRGLEQLADWLLLVRFLAQGGEE
jgi:CRISPR-associated protein Cmr2